MAKISIHIPDETLAKVREHKDCLNISRICSNALLKEVETISRVPAMVDETRKLIERLRSEEHVQHVESFDLGVRIARSYLQKASSEQLSYWSSLVFSERKRLVLPDEVEDYIERLILEKRFSQKFHRPSFAKGWLGVMQRSWETVKDKI
ncbi:hypothetical protein KY363_05710 [Candidatus Woesearchaeota archaeon]|nr:hypothetical protein [Candidatus Woesearchaeota archaeon]